MSDTFTSLFTGTLRGVMTVEEYEALAGRLGVDWAAVKFGDDGADVSAMTGEEAGELMLRLRDEVKGRNMLNVTFPYTYVHTPAEPRMIKIYDPAKCGSGCSTSSPDPWWVLSTVWPSQDELSRLAPSKKRKKTGLVSKIFGG